MRKESWIFNKSIACIHKSDTGQSKVVWNFTKEQTGRWSKRQSKPQDMINKGHCCVDLTGPLNKQKKKEKKKGSAGQLGASEW